MLDPHKRTGGTSTPTIIMIYTITIGLENWGVIGGYKHRNRILLESRDCDLGLSSRKVYACGTYSTTEYDFEFGNTRHHNWDVGTWRIIQKHWNQILLESRDCS